MVKKRKLLTLLEAEEIAERMRSSGRKVGMCHGVFDLLHPGHFAHFKAARAKVEVLFVSVTADKFVNKGPNRPLFSEHIRTETLSMIDCIDFVVVSNNRTAVESIKAIRPNIYFKGSDYAQNSDDLSGMISLEIDEVEKYGGTIHYTNELTSSSTTLINTYFSNHGEDFERWLQDFNSKFSLETVFQYLEVIQRTKIGVVGEIIIDRYTKCEPLSKSSKDPILAFEIHETETFMGGVLAIRDNIQNWGGEVSLFSSVPKLIPIEQRSIIREIKKLKNFYSIESENKLIIKHRFVDSDSNSRIFETYDFDQDGEIATHEMFFDILSQQADALDLWIVADYGHGLISKTLANKISGLKNFIAVNTQANAGNRGYNTITKYPKADFLCLNGGELQLERRDKHLDYEQVVPEYMKRLKARYAIVTLGSKGMMVFSNEESTLIPALGSRVVDKVGAGDSVLAVSSILARHNAPIEIIGLVSSIVAAHEISQLGHRSSLKISDLKKSVKAILA